MTGRFVVLFFLSTLFITSCDKQDEQVKKKYDSVVLIVQSEKKNDIYISGWKAASSWNVSNKSNTPVFANSFSIDPDVSVQEQSIILVFARKLWENEPLLEETDAVDQPLQMPFHFLPYFEEPGYTEHWDYKIENKKIEVVLTVQGTEVPKPPKKKVELQFVVIPKHVLSKKQQTEIAVKKMSYEEVLKTFDLRS